jgi:outer membrane receptor protein involved in Fe transport
MEQKNRTRFAASPLFIIERPPSASANILAWPRLRAGGIRIVRLAKLLMLSATIATATLGAAVAGEAQANTLNAAIAPMPLNRALEQYAKQTGLQVVYVSATASGVKSSGAAAGLTREAALRALLSGTGLESRFIDSSTVTITKAERHTEIVPIQIAQAAPSRPAVETVTVTSSKLGGADVQSIPIAITALSQEQLTATQTAGGPDLVKQVPNLTFTKTNFTGYSIQIRGIGTQAISVATDPAVAVAFNDVPFIRNHFFEQEFYDVGQVEILRGPQGTLYGRNATAGVVNLISAKPTDQFEAMASADIGNYHQRRFEGMVNIPIVDDRLDIRVAGEWTKRQGYSFNEITNQRIDGRDLWSGRVTIGWKPLDRLQTYLIWEHFAEDDDRIRSSKQLCKKDPGLSEVAGVQLPPDNGVFGTTSYLSQGCLPTSLYSPEAFQTPNGFSFPFIAIDENYHILNGSVDPYLSTVQSTNLRVIESTLDPTYKAKNDVVEFNADYQLTSELTFTSQTGFNHDFLRSTEDFNRFNTSPGIFNSGPWDGGGDITDTGVFCDPQLGCTDRLVSLDMSNEHAWQLSQEFRLASHFTGPLNFSLGGNYLHYETEENYYVFNNAVTAYSLNSSLYWTGIPTGLPPGAFGGSAWPTGFSNGQCLYGRDYYNPGASNPVGCVYIDPNPLSSLDNEGHNYFLSQNPYLLDSYAAFGEVYYQIFSDLKLVGGLRYTEDRKHFVDIPSWIAAPGYGYASDQVIDQNWGEFTGRATANWTPKLDFTDQTLVYLSYAHGYKAGGANPPGPTLLGSKVIQVAHPMTFAPEFVDAFELGTKNTLFDGALTVNADAFYYNYENYQISQIVDRTSINLNFDAHVKGAELEATWEPLPGLRFNFAGGYENTSVAKGSHAIDLMDRTAGQPGWVVIKPFITQSSNCVIPAYVIAAIVQEPHNATFLDLPGACVDSYVYHGDPVHIPPPGYPGYDYRTAPNNGEGFFKDLGGNELPNAPPFTVSLGAQYSMPLTTDWAGTMRGDFYWQDQSWGRIFNDDPYDRIHGYKNFNLALIFTNQAGWQVMLYDKNVFNTTAITGTFLNSDDAGLTTNLFLTDPKLIGIRVTKNW